MFGQVWSFTISTAVVWQGSRTGSLAVERGLQLLRPVEMGRHCRPRVYQVRAQLRVMDRLQELIVDPGEPFPDPMAFPNPTASPSPDAMSGASIPGFWNDPR